MTTKQQAIRRAQELANQHGLPFVVLQAPDGFHVVSRRAANGNWRTGTAEPVTAIVHPATFDNHCQ